MDNDKNEACARIMGYEQIQSALYRFPTWRRGNEMIKLRAPDYGSDPALLGEMLARFDERGYETLIHQFKQPDDKVVFNYRKPDTVSWEGFRGATRNEAVRDALIAAGGEHD